MGIIVYHLMQGKVQKSMYWTQSLSNIPFKIHKLIIEQFKTETTKFDNTSFNLCGNACYTVLGEAQPQNVVIDVRFPYASILLLHIPFETRWGFASHPPSHAAFSLGCTDPDRGNPILGALSFIPSVGSYNFIDHLISIDIFTEM